MAAETGHRRSIRLRGYDYTRQGAYFVTVCTEERRRVFGTVVNGRMALNDAGRVVRDEWLKSAAIRHEIVLDEWVDMPDHFHAIVAIRNPGDAGDPPVAPLCDRQVAPAFPAPPACVISGFLSPMERDVFDACLADGTPMIQVLARGLPESFPPRVQRAIDEGRLLGMTPFDATVARINAARAAWCNQYLLHAADRIVIGSLAPRRHAGVPLVRQARR